MISRALAVWRRPLAFWLPIFGVLGIIAAGHSSFGEMTVTIDSDEDDDLEYYHPFWFHDEGVLEQTRIEGFHFDENGTELFDAEPFVWTDYDEVSDRGFLDLDAMEILARDIDRASSRGVFLALIVLTGLAANLRKPFDEDDSTTASWLFTGLLLLAGLSAMLGVFAIVTDYGEAVESAAENDVTGFTIQPTVSGSADERNDDQELSITWSPGGALWLQLLASLVLFAGAALHAPNIVQRIDDGLEGDYKPPLPSFVSIPEMIQSRTPALSLAVLGLLVLGAFILPWFTMEQHIHAVEMDDVTASEHEFGWSITQWQVWATSNSLFEVDDPDDATTDSSFDGHGDHPLLGTVISEVTGMRWATSAALILVVFAGSLSITPAFRERIGGGADGWRFLLLAGVILTMGIGTSGFEDAVGESVVIDAHRLSPDANAQYVWDLYEGPDNARGSMLGMVDIDSNSSGLVESIWTPGPAFAAATTASMVSFVMLLDLIFVAARRPGTLDAVREGRRADLFDATPWATPLTIASVVGLLIVSMLGSGVGSLLLHPSMGAPEELDKWEVTYNSVWRLEETEWETLSDGETLEFAVQPSMEGHQHLRGIELSVQCGEGNRGLVTDESDTFDVEIIPPQGIDFSNLEPLSFTLEASSEDCEWQYSRIMLNNALEPVQGEYWSVSAEEALKQSGYDSIGTLQWSFRITANVNGGSTPVDQDSNAEARFMVYVDSYNLTAERV